MKVDIKRLFDELVADGTEPIMAKVVIESMVHEVETPVYEKEMDS